MDARLSFVTLGVEDLERSVAFYEDVLHLPRIPMPPGADVAFFELGRTWLSLYPRTLLAADAGVPPERAGFPGFSLAHNVRTVSGLAGGKPIIAVVKNNAYGLGLATAGPLLDRLDDVQALAVVRPDEALTLRDAGVRKPVLLMGPATEDELVELVRRDVVQSPYRDAAPAALSRVAQRAGRPVRVHLYVDTGMHRMGMPIAQVLP